MKITSTYSVKIKHYNRLLKETVWIYRRAVDFFVNAYLLEWEQIELLVGSKRKLNYIERLCISTKKHPEVIYDFEHTDHAFYKFPCYLRRAAISEALGKVSSYKSNLKNGQDASPPKAGFVYPAMYRDNMFVMTGTYTARIKVFVRNTWDWISIDLKKSDVDYILHHCKDRKHCVPTLQKRGKEWFLDFVFEENTKLNDTNVYESRIVAVDLGINNACTCSIMTSDGTILGRRFLKLSKEQDCLTHAVNRIKKAQQNRAKRTPRLWNRAKGINDDIAVKTAQFIIDTAVLYNGDVIVFEHLQLNGKKKGSKKQRLHLWKAKYVQSMVRDKAHRLSMRVSRVNAWGTSKYAYDGSGPVKRGRAADFDTYSLCRFTNGKVYNCDLSASYNIGARYFLRELLKSFSEMERLHLEAKVPQVCKRSTCTLSTLISLNAELRSNVAA